MFGNFAENNKFQKCPIRPQFPQVTKTSQLIKQIRSQGTIAFQKLHFLGTTDEHFARALQNRKIENILVRIENYRSILLRIFLFLILNFRFQGRTGNGSIFQKKI